MAGNDAEGKAPTFEQEMAKFQGFSVKDGEIDSGKGESAADIRAAAEEAERRAAEVNKTPHKENVANGTTTTENKTAAQPAEITLTEDEEETALQALLKDGKTADDLTQAEMEKAVADALAAKKAAAEGKTGRAAKKAARYDDNHRARKAAEREAASLRERLAAMEKDMADIRAGRTPLTAKKDAATTSGELEKPDHTDTAKYQYGELDAKYIADLARYETLKALADDRAKNGTKQQTQAEEAAQAEFKERVDAVCEAGREEFDDFDEVVTDTLGLPENDPAFWPLSATMGELILESDHGPAIAYELASDPKEAKRIFKLSAPRQAIWFGQKEAELSAGSAATAKDKPAQGQQGNPAGTQRQQTQARESKAPIPLRTRLNGSGGNRVPTSATTDFAAFEALARQKRK